MYDCKAPLSRFYYPDTRRIINAFIIIIIIYYYKQESMTGRFHDRTDKRSHTGNKYFTIM